MNVTSPYGLESGMPFPDNNRHIFQTVGPRCPDIRCRGNAALPIVPIVYGNWY
jgi:hypothetical protein